MNFNVNKNLFIILQRILNKLQLYKLTKFSKIYDNGWWIRNEIKILILGSSFAKCHIIPKVIHKLNPKYADNEIANFAQSMGAPYEMYISLKKNQHYLNKLEYVYIGIDPHILGEKFYHYMHVEKQFTTYEQWNYLFNQNKDYMNKYHKDLKISTLSPILFLKELFIKYYRKNSQYNGFEPRRISEIKVFDEKKIKEYTYGDLDLFPVSEYSIKYLKDIHSFIEINSNAKIIYFLSPSYNWQIGYEKYCKEFDKQLVDLLNKYLGEICIKGSLFKESFELNQFHFSDNRHLGYLGAVKYTKALFSDIDNIKIDKINPLYSYHPNYSFKENIQIFNTYLEKLKEELLNFIENKENIILYGFNNVSRVITAILSDVNLKITISDNNSFLGSLPNFLEDNFITKKPILSINKINEKNYDGIIITNLSNYSNEVSFLNNHNFPKDKIFRFSSKEIDFSYLHMQINLLFNLFDYIEKHFSNITIIGDSVIQVFIKERFKFCAINCIKNLDINYDLDNNSIYIVLSDFKKNKNILRHTLKINYENIVILDL